MHAAALRLMPCALALSSALLLAACGGAETVPASRADSACMAGSEGTVVVGSGLPGDPAAPEPASGYRVGRKVAYAKTYLVASANPLASKAGCDVLRDGGSAVDAAVAVQMVLGLVEPQSSGLGGGAFMLHYDAATRQVQAYDGRETAPAAATENYLRWVDDATNQTTPLPNARASGRSIGTPGAVRMLALAHQEHGRKTWKELLQPGIDLATRGFPIGGRLAAAIEGARSDLLRDAEARAAYFNADTTSKALGTVLRLPAYAATLSTLADDGPQALYGGRIAQAIVNRIRATTDGDGGPVTPGKTTLADLSGYQAKKRDAVCTTYRSYWVCGMPPPSSGGITVASTLGILENFELDRQAPTALDIEGGKPRVSAVHLISEAERLAYADRDKYIADTDFVALPGGSWDTMLGKSYLTQRSRLIRTDASLGTAQPGELGTASYGQDTTPEGGTSHFTVVDKAGNVVSMTTTVESSFGAFRMTQGFILNNQLTDFSATPTDSQGRLIANRVAPGKRPRSSMAPTLVFRKASDGSRGDFFMGTGSPGGSTIIQYVVKTLVGALDWGLDAQQATSMVDFGAANGPTTNVGGEHPNVNAAAGGGDDALVSGLRALGHTVSTVAQSSGISTVMRTSAGGAPAWAGGADPRREGVVLGDLFVP